MSSPKRRMRRVHHEEIGLQIAPMIDVTLLLLFFFMLSGKLTKSAKMMNINVPTASAARIPDNMGDRDVINIDENGQFFAGNDLMTTKQLTAHLKERFKNYPPLKLYVRADATTPAKKVKELMAIASDAGAIEVIYGVRQK